VLHIKALLNDLCHGLCADSDYFCVASFSVLKEDPHCVVVQSDAVPDGTAEVNHGQNCSSDKTPNMEDKLQEVEKVIILCIKVNIRTCSAQVCVSWYQFVHGTQ
jgi:hypothetical protein